MSPVISQHTPQLGSSGPEGSTPITCRAIWNNRSLLSRDFDTIPHQPKHFSSGSAVKTTGFCFLLHLSTSPTAAGLGRLVWTLQYNRQLMGTPGTASPLRGDKRRTEIHRLKRVLMYLTSKQGRGKIPEQALDGLLKLQSPSLPLDLILQDVSCHFASMGRCMDSFGQQLWFSSEKLRSHRAPP